MPLDEPVRGELGRQTLLDEYEAYLADLMEAVGEPSTAEVARADALVRRIAEAKRREA